MIRIIRTQQPPPQAPPAAAPQFIDVSDEIETLLADAREQAAEMVAEASRRVEEICRQARQEGLAQAQRENAQAIRTAVDQRLESLVPAIQAAVDAIQAERVHQLRGWEQDLIRLAVAIAQRVVRGALQRQPEIQLEWIREALELAAGNPTLKLHLHPADREALQEPLQRLLVNRSEAASLEVVADPQVERGGCVVETEQGTIDQQLQTQLARIEDELV